MKSRTGKDFDRNGLDPNKVTFCSNPSVKPRKNQPGYLVTDRRLKHVTPEYKYTVLPLHSPRPRAVR